MAIYRELIDKENGIEGLCMQEVVSAILSKIGLSEDEFTDNVEYYKKDPVNYPKLKEITSITQEAMLELKMNLMGIENKTKLITVDQASTLYQVKLQIHLTLLNQIYGMDEADRPATMDTAF